MTADDIRKYKEATPFGPFKIALASGEELVVGRRGALGIAPEGRFLISPLEAGGYRLVAPAEITSVKAETGTAA